MSRRRMLSVLGVFVALCIAVSALSVLGHRRTGTSAPASGLAVAFPLDGDGIGNLRFGDTPDQLVAGLKPLLGLPEGASTRQRPNGLVRGICGFDDEIDWTGLPERATGFPNSHSAGLTVYFKHWRFVGYSYGPPWGDRNTPLVRHGVMLSTRPGLGLDEPIARAQQLYGTAFVITRKQQGTPPNPRLEPLPAWHVKTTTGVIHGYIDKPTRTNSNQNRSIGSISAGSTPNTPCRTTHTTTKYRSG